MFEVTSHIVDRTALFRARGGVCLLYLQARGDDSFFCTGGGGLHAVRTSLSVFLTGQHVLVSFSLGQGMLVVRFGTAG